MAGRCYTELGRPLRAEPLLCEAIAQYDTTHTRETALYLTWLTEDYIQAREIDQAALTASRALTLAGRVNSTRTGERMTAVHHLLKPFRQNRAVRDFNDQYRSTTRTS